MTTRAPDVQDDSGGVLSASAVMAVGTLLSRLSGFVRAAMIAAALGISVHADQFNVANTIPNMLYILLAGGIFNAVLVPQLVRARKADADEGAAYTSRVLTFSTIGLGAATIALVAAAPQVMRLFLDPAWYTPELQAQLSSLIDLSRYCLAQIFFYGMFVLVGQILNARGRFGPMMWAPIANNAVSIAVLTLYLALYGAEGGNGAYTSSQELLLGLGATLGIVVQLLVLLPYLRASGIRLRPRFDFYDSGLGRTLRLGGWTLLFVVVNQITYTVVVRLATSGSAAAVTQGVGDAAGYTVYSNAFLLVMVPHSVVTVSLTAATLPAVSRLAADSRWAELSSELSSSLRLALSVIVPFAVAIGVLGPALATVVFGWGAAAGNTAPLGLTLVAFAPGLVLFTVHYLALRGFYALEDTRTPFVIQCLIAAVQIGLAVLLTALATPRSVAPMLALAFTGSYLVGACACWLRLSNRVGGSTSAALTRFLARLVAAAIPAALVGWLVAAGAAHLGADVGTDRVHALCLAVVCGGLIFALFALLARALRISEVGSIVAMLSGRIRRSGTSVS